jgi:hypothetical protein
MDLWRAREYPVDKSCFRARDGVSKGFQDIDFNELESQPIKNNDQVKYFIKKLYHRDRVCPRTGAPL